MLKKAARAAVVLAVAMATCSTLPAEAQRARKPKKPASAADAGAPPAEAADAAPAATATPSTTPAAATTEPTTSTTTTDATTTTADAGPPATSSPSPSSSPDEGGGGGAGGASAASSEGPTFTIGGRIFGYARMPIEHPVTDPFQQVSTSAWLEGKAKFNEATSAKVVVAIDALTPSLDGTTEVRGRLREGFATAHGHGLDFRVGQQIIAWGNADGVNVLDLLSATDFRFFSADPDVRKIGAFATRLSWVPGEDGPVEITLVWQPVAPVSSLLFPASLIPQGVTLAEPVRPKPSLSNSEVGGKIQYNGSGWDIAAIGFYGYNHLPEFYLARQDATGIVIGQSNYRYLATGGEASLSTGKWVFRAEGSYVFTESNRGAIAFIQPSYFGGILGIERPFGERVRVNAQGVIRYYPYWTDPIQQVGRDPALQGIAAANSITQNYTDPLRPGATLRIAYTSESEAFEAEVFGLAYFTGFDYVVRPAVGYHLSDAFKLQLGAEYFGGDRTRSIGSLHPFSGVFTQATFTF